MNHLDNTTLNLYLDDALDSKTRAAADAHLAKCETCQREFASLRALSASFDAWRAEPIPRDVSAQVMARVAQRPAPAIVSRWGAVLLGAQVLFAALLLMWVLPTVLRVMSGLPIQIAPTVTLNPFASLVALSDSFTLPFPTIALWVWALALLGVAVLWFVGNRLIFTSLNHKQEASQ